MVPSEYIETVVLPTLLDYLRAPNDRRLAYLSAISAYHVMDYVMRTASLAARPARDAEYNRIQDEIIALCPDAFNIVEGICNGTKHCGRDDPKKAQFTPGDETLSRPFGFGPGFAGFGEGTFGPQRILVEHNGRQHVVDEAVVQFLRACQNAFPTHLAGIDLSGLHV
ncbi:hypothetical protein MKL09_21925 [Methylobacterium sp. J-048]|uniref:hypothetical protein n=1 Tax=Methylobacterium sp. J-048 TaxID=2836635 RepID=UPI001FB8F3DA|nr:hypothetical protein [Methylobacterium sp. J-048]MCJ2059186.1 hypothetical protein [Methylobacterium sp. J-048]